MSLTLTLKRGSDTITGEGTDFTLYGTVNGGELDSVQLKGDTTQATYTGKNLFDVDGQVVAQSSSTYSISDGAITVTQSNASQHNALIGIKIPNSDDLLGKTINISFNAKSYSGATGGRVILWDNATTQSFITLNTPDAQGNISGSVALPNSFPGSSTFFVLYFYTNKANTGGSAGGYTVFTNVQIEVGSAKTSYEPYTGGVASPSPDYPQNVNVVSGTQTITITDGGSQSQTKTVRLGSIELAKIGTYQDYIYKSGDDWYVHKETKKLDVSALTGWYYNNNTNFRTLTGISDIVFPADNNTVGAIISANYMGQTANSIANGDYDYAIGLGSASYISVRNKDITTLQAFETYLANNQVYAYVALATATDTKITDAELTTDLDRLVEASTYNGATTVSISGNLAAYLVVESGGTITKTYTEAELSSPLTISDVEGKSQNTTLDGNIYVDFAYNKRQFSVDIFNLTPTDYAEIRAFYTFQFTGTRFPTISIPELEISDMPVFMEISARNIVNQCLLTDKITLKFRETVQP